MITLIDRAVSEKAVDPIRRKNTDNLARIEFFNGLFAVKSISPT
jgi:hypothetical protein